MSTLSSDVQTLSYEAYVYFYPLVIMDVTRQQMINVEADAKPGLGPANTFHHMRTFPSAEFRVVVRPNFDTLYSSAWLDLTAGPVKLKVPDTDDRYYMLPMLDMWTDVFANPGKRTTGTAEQEWVIVGPHHTGDLPAGLPRIVAPTPYVWIIGRTQTNGPADYPAVNKVQDGFTLTPLAATPDHPVDPDLDEREPMTIVNTMSAIEFFTRAAEIMKTNPPHLTDVSIVSRTAGLGLVPGEDFNPDALSGDERAALETGAKAALSDMFGALSTLGTKVNGWIAFTDTMGVYGNYYLKRAVIALLGLGANPAEDATYPLLGEDADGDTVSGELNYVLHFDADELPPVYAFWSVTMYDAEGFQVANELNRFALGDRDDLVYNSDGSLDLYLQHTNPGPEHEANWLPAPHGELGVTMRLYAPKPEALDGRWHAPALVKA
ncbi:MULTISPECIES: DUF1254 domain-containing protein [Actinomycetes]|uniref:DUF1254 domain-containing protein n=1 Tax=Actinomycetes TaxID=1760 RepID=UPI0004C1C419|nr:MULTISPECIES: DUF1254 domain-containing protein [Actinomycetes]